MRFVLRLLSAMLACCGAAAVSAGNYLHMPRLNAFLQPHAHAQRTRRRSAQVQSRFQLHVSADNVQRGAHIGMQEPRTFRGTIPACARDAIAPVRVIVSVPAPVPVYVAHLSDRMAVHIGI